MLLRVVTVVTAGALAAGGALLLGTTGGLVAYGQEPCPTASPSPSGGGIIPTALPTLPLPGGGSGSATPTGTPSETPTGTPEPTSSVSASPDPSVSPTGTEVPSAEPTCDPEPTESVDPSATATGTAVPTASETSSESPSPAPAQERARSVSLEISHDEITAGNAPRLSGVVKDASGAPLQGVQVTLYQKQGRAAYEVIEDGSPVVTSDAQGRFTALVRPQQQTSYGANVSTDVRSNVVNTRVHGRVDITAPTNGRSPRRVVVSGSVLPDREGIPVALRVLTGGGSRYLGETKAGPGGDFRVRANVDLAPGRYVIVVQTPATSVTLAGARSLTLTIS